MSNANTKANTNTNANVNTKANTKAKSTPMTPDARSRIASATAKNHGGKIPADSFASHVDAIVQRQAAREGTSQNQKH